jgi:hypothetical protein
MKTASEIREKQTELAKRMAATEVRSFNKRIELQVQDASAVGLHQTSIAVPDPLVASVAALGLSFERLGYTVKIEKETGWFGAGLYRKPTTILTLGW